MVFTEAELKDRDTENQMRFSDMFMDKQDGVVDTFSADESGKRLLITLTPDVLEGINKRIEEWMDEKTEDAYLSFTVSTESGYKKELRFNKYVVNFMECRNYVSQWLIVKASFQGYPKFHTRFLQSVQLPGDCFQYDENERPVAPNLFNLVHYRQIDEVRKHSSALSLTPVDPDPTQKEEVS